MRSPERAYLAFERLARAYAASGEPSRFVALCEGIIRNDPRDWRARLALARHLRGEARHEEAFGLLLRAMEANPQVLLVHLEMLRTLRALGVGQRCPGPVPGHSRGGGVLPRPAHLHGLPLSRRRHAVALSPLPPLEHPRRGAPGTRGDPVAGRFGLRGAIGPAATRRRTAAPAARVPAVRRR